MTLTNRLIHYCYELGMSHLEADSEVPGHFGGTAGDFNSYPRHRAQSVSTSIKNGINCARKKNSRRISLRGRVGKDKVEGQRIVDCTAGRGFDALYFLALGYHQVRCYENNPVIYLLLRDALDRLIQQDESLGKVIQLTFGSASHDGHLQGDVAYFDPMYPEDKRARLSGKEMVWIKELQKISPSYEEDLFFNELLQRFPRVVVKRPPRAKTFSEKLKPESVHEGKGARYERYKGYSQAAPAR